MATKRKKWDQPVITTMRFPPDVMDRVDARADLEGVSRTQIVIGLIRKHCRVPREKKPAAPSVFD